MRRFSRSGSHSSSRVLVYGNARVCAFVRYGTFAFVAFLLIVRPKFMVHFCSSRTMRSHCQEFEVLLIVVADVVVVNDRFAFEVIMVVMASVIGPPFVVIPSNQRFLIIAVVTPLARGAPEVRHT